MFKNYIILTFRNILKQKAYSFINIFGLAVGITSFLIILLYVQNELSYNRHIEDARNKGIMLATAESCTGGLVAGAITDVPGSSDVFERGFVTYSNAAKTEIPADTANGLHWRECSGLWPLRYS